MKFQISGGRQALVLACLNPSLGKMLFRPLTIGVFDKIRSIYTISEQANSLRCKAAQEGTAGFINAYDIAQKEIYWFTIRRRLVAARLDRFDAFARNLAVDRETCSLLAELLV